jgi:hypothetical protein
VTIRERGGEFFGGPLERTGRVRGVGMVDVVSREEVIEAINVPSIPERVHEGAHSFGIGLLGADHRFVSLLASLIGPDG